MSLSDLTDIDDAPEQGSQTSANLSYLDGLNEHQKQAVETTEGPLLVLAGAGTGKTRVLTTRLAHLLHTKKAFPGQILAVTFTNKAAQEMRERVSQSLGGAMVEGWWLGTFHALCVRMLRRHSDLVGLESNFTIIDTDDQVRLIKQLMEDENIDTKKWAPKMIAAMISGFKDKAKKPADLSMNDVGEVAGGKFLRIYQRYQERLKVINAADFGDLLLYMITIFKNPDHAHILEQYQKQFKYILVDEYQDTNVAQYLWLRLLAQGSKNICCVGDDDQSIYGWRGAEVGNILRFEKDFPGAQIIRLEQNYRSTSHILKAASSVIAHNESRLGKELWSEAPDGEKILVKGLWDGQAEARFVGEEIENLKSKGVSYNDIAIMVRAGFQTRIFEERLLSLAIPCVIIGGQRFYERAEIRDALAYFRVVLQPSDDLALERIINTPKRGIGKTTLQKLQIHARSTGIHLHQAIKDFLDTDEIRGAAQNSLTKLLNDFDRWREDMSQIHHCELAKKILDESGYIKMWEEDTKAPDAQGRVENLKELVSAMEEFEDFPTFMEHVALVMENQSQNHQETVTISTLHGSKGLEYKYVFLAGWEEGLFPSQRSMDETGLKGLEEERRLAYVGITRAREKAYITHAAHRMTYGNWINSIPSRFIDELPEDCVELVADQGVYGSGRSSHWDSSGYEKQEIPAFSSFKLKKKTATEDGQELMPGHRVMHEKFGKGTILNIDGNKLDITFENAGRKRVLKNFVQKV